MKYTVLFLFSIFNEAIWGIKGTRKGQINGVLLEGEFAMCGFQAGLPLPSQIRPRTCHEVRRWTERENRCGWYQVINMMHSKHRLMRLSFPYYLHVLNWPLNEFRTHCAVEYCRVSLNTEHNTICRKFMTSNLETHRSIKATVLK